MGVRNKVFSLVEVMVVGGLLSACQGTAPRQGGSDPGVPTAAAPVVSAPAHAKAGAVNCAKTGLWTWVGGQCDSQLRVQGMGTVLAGGDVGLAFTGSIKDGLPSGPGSLVTMERIKGWNPADAKGWKVSRDGVQIPSFETHEGEILSRELEVKINRPGNAAQAFNMSARINTSDRFRFESAKNKPSTQISVELGEVVLRASRVDAGSFRSEAEGFRNKPAEVVGVVRDGFIGAKRLELNLSSGKIRSAAAGFEYEGPMRATCWSTKCSVHLLGLRPTSGKGEGVATQAEQKLTVAGQSYTFVPAEVSGFVLYFKSPDGTEFDARIPECAKQQRGALLDTRNNTQPPKLVLANTCGQLRTPVGVDFRGTFDARGNPIQPDD